MKAFFLVLCLGLLAACGDETFAQGGGCRCGGAPRASSGGEAARQFTGSITSSPELARQYLMQMQQVELARQYQMQLQKAATEEAERVAQEADEKRQEKIEAIKKRRADELARREAVKARNLARRQAGTTELASQNRVALSK